MLADVYSLAALAILLGAGNAAAPERMRKPLTLADPVQETIVTGIVRLEEDPPRTCRIKMEADAKCSALHAETPISEELVVAPDGALKWAFVHVKKGLEGRPFPIPAQPALLDQVECRYVPPVLGVQAGQPLRIRNSDDLEFNSGQRSKGRESIRIFDKPETMIRIKSDVHPWMTAWVGVVPHPFYAVTDENGSFTLRGLPPGRYELEVWHSVLGSTSQAVEVTKDVPAALSITLRRTKDSSLRVCDCPSRSCESATAIPKPGLARRLRLDVPRGVARFGDPGVAAERMASCPLRP